VKIPKYPALRTLLAAAAVGISRFAAAADLPVQKAPPPPPPFSWTGFYVGGNLGGAWAGHSLTDNIYGLTWDTGTDKGAFVGGGQAGFNYQYGTLVVGVEAEFDGIANSNNGRGVFVAPLGDTITVTRNNRWITTLAARFGVAHENLFIFAKGGGGWIGNNGLTVTDLTTGASITGIGNDKTGFLGGVGAEWAPVNHWTVKAEFELFTMSNRTITVPLGAPVLASDSFTGNRNVLIAKVGFNYLFN
jgi:outer membrane immunogenic protein